MSGIAIKGVTDTWNTGQELAPKGVLAADCPKTPFRLYTEGSYTGGMVSKTEFIWRHLLAGSAEGRRRYTSVTALARDLGIPVSTTHQALARPAEIGAVTIDSVAGLRVLDPVRLLTLYCSRRHLARDIVTRVRVEGPVEEVERLISKVPGVTMGGFAALIAHTTGVNRVADYNTVLVYGRAAAIQALPLNPEGSCEIILARPDPWLRNYGALTPAAQAYADVFNLRDWQASRFIHEVDPGAVVISPNGELPREDSLNDCFGEVGH